MSKPLVIQRMAGSFAICRMRPTAQVPEWAMRSSSLMSITRTETELSIIAQQAAVPVDVRAERDYAAFAVVGPLEFSMVGVLAMLTGALAEAEVPVLAVSTYDTDILLVKREQCEIAETALRRVATVVSRASLPAWGTDG